MSDPADLTHRAWRFPEYIAALGPLLTPAQALDYFSHSIFWDKQSTNQVLRMQTMHAANGEGAGAGGGMDEGEELRKFTGVEFAVVHGRGRGLWVVHKRERLGPDEVRPVAAYFIMNDTIYQSPDLYTVFSTSLVNALHSLQASLSLLRAAHPTYTPREGYTWPLASKPNPKSKSEPEPADQRTLLNPMTFAFQTSAQYITTSSARTTRHTPEEDAAAAEEESAEPDVVPPSASASRDRAGTRESLTPAPPGGVGGGKGKGGGGGGKSKRRRKSRALTENSVDSPAVQRLERMLTDGGRV